MQSVARSGTAVFDARFREEGVLTDADPVLVDVSDPNDVQLVANASPTTHPSTGRYTYSFTVASDAPLGIWRIDWEGTINGAPVSGGEIFEVVAAASIVVGDFWPTVGELGTLLARPFGGDEEIATAQRCLDSAKAAFQGEAAHRIEAVDGDTVKLTGSFAARIFLPEPPIRNVTRVKVNGTVVAVASYTWRRSGLLYRGRLAVLNSTDDMLASDAWWGGTDSELEVTYDHGFENIPEDVRTVVMQAAARLIGNPDGTAVAFTDDEKRVARRYRRWAEAYA